MPSYIFSIKCLHQAPMPALASNRHRGNRRTCMRGPTLGNRTSPHPCEFCGTETRNPRFCSNACHLKGTQEQRSAKLRKARPACPQCGTGTVMRGATYCSRACSDVANRATPLPSLRLYGKIRQAHSGTLLLLGLLERGTLRERALGQMA